MVITEAQTFTIFSLHLRTLLSMGQHALKLMNNCWNIKISYYLETSGGQSFNLYLNV
jgi:hypothetical protein